MTPTKSLVTGGTGFIGSHLVEALLEQGEEVRCLVRKTSSREWIRGLDVEVFQGDCTDSLSLASAVEGVDRIYHVAGVTKTTENGVFYRTNALGTENLIRACIERNPDLQRFIYLSSQAAVGPCEGNGLSVETDPYWPITHYGRSKRQAEEVVLKARDELDVIILRACTVYGPRDRDLLTLFRSIGRGIRVGLWGVEHRLSLCYVSDLVSAMVLAGKKDFSSGEIFFISDGNVYAWRDLGRTIAEVMGVRTVHVSLPISVFRWSADLADWISRRSGRPRIYGRERFQEMIQPNWCCDATKAMSELNFCPAFDLKRGITTTVAWYRMEGWLKK